jgi:hypothetical protein
MWSSLEGNGHRVASEHYPFQGLDLSVFIDGYGLQSFTDRVIAVQCRRSNDIKYLGQRTPFGTPVTHVVRRDGEFLNGFGGEYLESQCGNCRVPMDRCRCDFSTLSRGPLGESEIFDRDL